MNLFRVRIAYVHLMLIVCLLQRCSLFCTKAFRQGASLILRCSGIGTALSNILEFRLFGVLSNKPITFVCSEIFVQVLQYFTSDPWHLLSSLTVVSIALGAYARISSRVPQGMDAWTLQNWSIWSVVINPAVIFSALPKNGSLKLRWLSVSGNVEHSWNCLVSQFSHIQLPHVPHMHPNC